MPDANQVTANSQISDARCPQMTQRRKIRPFSTEQLQSEVAAISNHDVLLVIGDLNAKVGSDNTGREDHMSKHGPGEINDQRLL